MRISFFVLLVLLIFSLIFFLLRPEYNSAFEADQQCHFQMKTAIDDNFKHGCDHDLETRQWILFEAGEAEQPAKVLKRFRY